MIFGDLAVIFADLAVIFADLADSLCLQAVAVETGDSFIEDSDSEVFDGNSFASERVFPRTSSSSSSRKSSYEDDKPSLGGGGDHQSLPESRQMETASPADHIPSTSPPPPEWKPQVRVEPLLETASPTMPSGSPCVVSKGVEMEGVESPVDDLKALYGSTVTVTIDPPRDDDGGEVDAAVSRYLDGGGGGVCPVAEVRSLADMFGKGSDEEGEVDLFETLDKTDLAEQEEVECAPPTKICLLSK